MTRIAFASEDGKNIAGHFGHCPFMIFVDIEDGKITKRESINTPAHTPGAIPKFVSDNNANYIVAGGMGAMAQELFEQNNIKVIVGAQGSIDEAINAFLSDSLESTNSVCDHGGEHHHH